MVKGVIQHATGFDVLLLAVDVDAERSPLRHDVEIGTDLVIASQCQPYLGRVSLYLLTGIRRRDECELLI